MSLSALDYWALLVRDDATLPLFEAALSVAQDEFPGLDIQAQLQQVDDFGARLRARTPADASMQNRVLGLNHLFFRELGFHGNVNDYYDPQNSYLNRVIERRCGLPITLSLLYIEIGQQAGIPLQGVAFPGHFLVKLRVGAGEAFLDVFNGGVSLSHDDLLARIEPAIGAAPAPRELLSSFLRAAAPREVLARVLRNLKAIYWNDKDWKRLLDIQHRLVMLLPDESAELRDRGIIFSRLECPRAAIDDLESYVAARPEAEDAVRIRARIEALRQAAGRLN